MKIIQCEQMQTAAVDAEGASGCRMCCLIGPDDAAPSFSMRHFEIAPGGHTPKHAHAWEHEMFIHAGVGEIYGNGKWNPVQPGNVIFMPPNEEHQIRNTGRELLILACLVPSIAPEL